MQALALSPYADKFIRKWVAGRGGGGLGSFWVAFSGVHDCACNRAGLQATRWRPMRLSKRRMSSAPSNAHTTPLSSPLAPLQGRAEDD